MSVRVRPWAPTLSLQRSLHGGGAARARAGGLGWLSGLIGAWDPRFCDQRRLGILAGAGTRIGPEGGLACRASDRLIGLSGAFRTAPPTHRERGCGVGRCLPGHRRVLAAPEWNAAPAGRGLASRARITRKGTAPERAAIHPKRWHKSGKKLSGSRLSKGNPNLG